MDENLFLKAREQLNFSWLKRDDTSFNSGSVAVTDNSSYVSGLMESRTHLLDVTSEQAALVKAVSCQDPHVKKVVTVVDGSFVLNPLVVKILCDHVRRTGTSISYFVYDVSGKELFSSDNVFSLFYSPSVSVLEKISFWKPCENWAAVDKSRPLVDQLRECAIKGMKTHFSASTKTCYGGAVVAGDRIYYGGVYSSYDRRLNLHSEMVAALSAIMDGRREISLVGVISNKFVDSAVHMCGCCRQFFSEIQEKTGIPITAVAFSFDGKKKEEIMLNDYLPSSWSSGKSFEERFG